MTWRHTVRDASVLLSQGERDLLEKQLGAFLRTARFFLREVDVTFWLLGGRVSYNFIWLEAGESRESLQAWEVYVGAPIQDLYQDLVTGLLACQAHTEAPLWTKARVHGPTGSIASMDFAVYGGTTSGQTVLNLRQRRVDQWLHSLNSPQGRTLYELEFLSDGDTK